MQVIHDFPTITHPSPPLSRSHGIIDKLQMVVDISACSIEEESCYRYRPVHEKYNDPPKVVSFVKEYGLDYFSPVMKYRG